MSEVPAAEFGGRDELIKLLGEADDLLSDSLEEDRDMFAIKAMSERLQKLSTAVQAIRRKTQNASELPPMVHRVEYKLKMAEENLSAAPGE